MKKQQIILVAGAVALLGVIFLFGRTVPPKETVPESPAAETAAFDIEQVLEASKARLTPEQQGQVTQLESAVVRGNVKEQQATVYRQLAAFYRDSAHLLLPFAYYTGEAAKLENSEKSLTFAAHFFLDNARKQQDQGMRKWMATESKGLFEQALVLDPENDSLKIGLGACYLFGNISANPMEGILTIREVAERDPSNMYAQYMLAMGGLMSGQLDRAIERFETVLKGEPDNVEVKLLLAETFERKGDKNGAIRWYEEVKTHVGNPDIAMELEKRIQSLKR